jgi:hypothetical protein
MWSGREKMTRSNTDTPNRDRDETARTFFFIHVMKTGGTSFVFDVLKTFPAERVYPNKTLDRSHPADIEPYTRIANLLEISPERRADIQVYAGHFPYMACEMMGIDFVKLTLLRHPVDRSISVLKQFKRLVERFHSSPLDEIYQDEYVFRHFIQNHQTKIFSLTREDNARAFLRAIDVDEHRLADAKANLAKVDVIGLNERYGDFIDELRDRYGWWPSGLDAPARSNVSREPWEAGEALRRQIALDNAIDLEFYDYARQLVEQRRNRPYDR